MNDSIERANIKAGRVKGKKEALHNVSLRIPREALEYYKQFPNHTGKMREVLFNFMKDQKR